MAKLREKSAVATHLLVSGLCCPDEIAQLKRELDGRPGVRSLAFNLMQSTMTVTHEPVAMPVEEIIRRVSSTGMSATVLDGQTLRDAQPAHRIERGRLIATLLSGVGTILGIALSYLPLAPVHGVNGAAAVVYTLAILSAWWYVGPKAWRALRAVRADMNVLMSIAVVGAVALGEWFEAATVASLFMLSELLESWSVGRARRAVAALLELAPQEARLLRADGTEEQVDAQTVRVGDKLVVRPGERFPVDGRVIEGTSSVNRAPITGESVPVPCEPGDEVWSGTINQEGAVVIEATMPPDQTVLANVVRLVQQAQSQPSRAERFVDVFARYYTPAVIALSVILCFAAPVLWGGSWSAWFYRALILLVIACPCALVISTPVAVVSGLAAAARNGILIKGGIYLEAAGAATAIAFDKTGTLTRGRPVVREVVPLDGVSAEEVLELAAAIEARGEHPIAQAIVAHARAQGIEPLPCSQYEAVPGRGAKATVGGERYLVGNGRMMKDNSLQTPELEQLMDQQGQAGRTAVAVASTQRPLGILWLADEPRPEAAAVIRALQQMHFQRLVMLTGDSVGAAEAIARSLGLSWQAELLPEDKVRSIEELRHGGRVVMVGDGINDAPALAAADVGVSMGVGASATAMETADVAILVDDLQRIPLFIRLSRQTRRVIAVNIIVALGIKAVFLGLAIPGWANLWMAIAADMGASLLVTLNGLRLLGERSWARK